MEYKIMTYGLLVDTIKLIKKMKYLKSYQDYRKELINIVSPYVKTLCNVAEPKSDYLSERLRKFIFSYYLGYMTETEVKNSFNCSADSLRKRIDSYRKNHSNEIVKAT